MTRLRTIRLSIARTRGKAFPLQLLNSFLNHFRFCGYFRGGASGFLHEFARG